MGKAKRFNPYDSAVAEQRKIVQSYGEARQKLSIGSSFRSLPLSPPVFTATDATAAAVSASFPLDYSVDDQGNKTGTVTHSLTATTAHKLQFTATGDCDITLTGIGSGGANAIDFYIEVIQDPTGDHTITFNDSEWDPVPSFGTAADTTSLISVHSDGDGKLRPILLLNAITTSFSGNLSDLTIDTDFDANGVRKYILDADADTYLIADTDDRIEFFTGGTEGVRIDNSEMQMQGGVNIDLNGNDLVFGTGVGEFMDQGASSDIRVFVASTQRAEFNATGLLLSSGYRLTVDDQIRLLPITKPGVTTSAMLYTEDLTNDELVLNAPTSGKVRMDIAGTEIAEFAAAAAQFQSPTGYGFTFVRDDASPNDDDIISVLDFQGNNVPTGTDIYARIAAYQRDVTTGTEDGELRFEVMDAGTRDMTMFLDRLGLAVQRESNTSELRIIRNESTPATGIIGELIWETQDDGNNLAEYGDITVQVDDLTAGNETSTLLINGYNNGTREDFINYTGGTGVTIIDGNGAADKLGFFNTTPVVQQTGVAVTAAGIHAALVNFGLITA